MATEIHGEVQDDDQVGQQQDEGATSETLDADADQSAQGDEHAGEGEAQAEEDGEVVITLGDVEITAPGEESVDGKPAHFGAATGLPGSDSVRLSITSLAPRRCR